MKRFPLRGLAETLTPESNSTLRGSSSAAQSVWGPWHVFPGAGSSDQIHKQPPRASAQLRRARSSPSLTQPRHELHRAHPSLHQNPCTSCGQARFLLCFNKSRCSKTLSGVSGGPPFLTDRSFPGANCYRNVSVQLSPNGYYKMTSSI